MNSTQAPLGRPSKLLLIMVVLLVAFASSALLVFTTNAQPPPPPNILIVLIDDLGIDQLLAYDDQNHYTDPLGYPYAHTPTIDYLAANGVRFNQARANPVCSPSRASLQCGKYGFRTGVGTAISGSTQGNPSWSGSFFEFATHPRPDEVSLADMVHAHSGGYQAAMIGKLHLQVDSTDAWPYNPTIVGTGDGYATTVLGYDTFRGSRRNLDQRPYPPSPFEVREGFTHYFWIEDNAGVVSIPVIIGPNGTYNTTHQRLELERWIADLNGQPFLAVWNLNDAHSPYTWPPQDLHGFGAAPKNSNNTYKRAKVEAIDTELGHLLDDNPPWLANTVIMVLGDNGTDHAGVIVGDSIRYPLGHPLNVSPTPPPIGLGDEVIPVDTTPYTTDRIKHSVYEGGVRVPLIVKGPGIATGESDVLVDIVDVFATVRELIYLVGSHPATDSISFAYALNAPSAPSVRTFSHGALFRPNCIDPEQNAELYKWYYIKQDAQGVRYKLIQVFNETSNPQLHEELYNLSTDPFETSPVQDVFKTNELRAALEALLNS